jgi:hypothetical protein
VAVYDLGSADGHVEYTITPANTPPVTWSSDTSWTGSGSLDAANANEFFSDRGFITVEDTTGDGSDVGVTLSTDLVGVMGNHIIAALFHRHVDGELVYSVVHRVGQAYERQVTVVSLPFYKAVLRFVRGIPEDEHTNNFSVLGLPTDVGWLGPLVQVPVAPIPTFRGVELSTADKTWTFGPRR